MPQIKKPIQNIYDDDVKASGSYLYTKRTDYSAYTANKRQTDEVIRLIKKYFPSNSRILDVGCGDGTYTKRLYEEIMPLKIVGFDLSSQAITIAQDKEYAAQKNIKFMCINIYDVANKFKKNEFDVAVIQGVLHHIEQPKKAIEKLSTIVNNIIILEPNGYNPFVKIIEKISPYHRLHREKSYWPPELQSWFEQCGYKKTEEKYFRIVPFFIQKSIAIVLEKIEPFFEQIPLLHKMFCGVVITLYQK